MVAGQSFDHPRFDLGASRRGRHHPIAGRRNTAERPAHPARRALQSPSIITFAWPARYPGFLRAGFRQLPARLRLRSTGITSTAWHPPKPRDAAVDGARNIPMTGRQTMVTKKEEAFVLKNLLALAAVETLGGAIALGMVFHLI
ncbi:hypothetical protein [Cupriavidus necator]|nr:hypothetical protein [Cupriavidus necator]